MTDSDSTTPVGPARELLANGALKPARAKLKDILDTHRDSELRAEAA